MCVSNNAGPAIQISQTDTAVWEEAYGIPTCMKSSNPFFIATFVAYGLSNGASQSMTDRAHSSFRGLV